MASILEIKIIKDLAKSPQQSTDQLVEKYGPICRFPYKITDFLKLMKVEGIVEQIGGLWKLGYRGRKYVRSLT